MIYIVSAILVVILLISAIAYILLSRQNQKTNPEVVMANLRCYVRDNHEEYGVSNHGNSMDDVEELQNVTPSKMGV